MLSGVLLYTFPFWCICAFGWLCVGFIIVALARSLISFASADVFRCFHVVDFWFYHFTGLCGRGVVGGGASSCLCRCLAIPPAFVRPLLCALHICMAVGFFDGFLICFTWLVTLAHSDVYQFRSHRLFLLVHTCRCVRSCAFAIGSSTRTRASFVLHPLRALLVMYIYLLTQPVACIH